jgi:hypothetical protein
MTVEPSSGGGHREPDARPELRATHADRDRTVEVLRDAAGDGQLTASELDERVEAALTARTQSELSGLTADLRAGDERPARDLVSIDQRFGDVERTGRWVVPQRMRIKATAGNVKLDFTEAVITHRTLHIELELKLGADLLLVTKPGIVVETDDLTVRMGDIKIRHVADQVPVTLTVRVSGQVRGGDVVARFPRRSFWQWVRREPPPYRSLTS